MHTCMHTHTHTHTHTRARARTHARTYAHKIKRLGLWIQPTATADHLSTFYKLAYTMRQPPQPFGRSTPTSAPRSGLADGLSLTDTDLGTKLCGLAGGLSLGVSRWTLTDRHGLRHQALGVGRWSLTEGWPMDSHLGLQMDSH